MRKVTIAGGIYIFFVACGLGASGAQSLQTFELKEWFGVNHPDQIVEFNLEEPVAKSSGRLEDEKGNGVQYQLLEHGKKLALYTDLQSGNTKRWRWFPNKAASTNFPATIELNKHDNEFELTNGKIAVRIPTAEAIKKNSALRPQSPLQPLVDLFNYGPSYSRLLTLAPIQGVRLNDGNWTGNGPNALVVLAKSLTDAHVDLIESGPLKTVVQVRYDFDKPAYAYGPVHISDPGPGYLIVTITVIKDQPTVLLEEETDLDEVWSFNVWEGLIPNQGSYRGHAATNPLYGHNADGSVYSPQGKRGDTDAIVDLQYDHPQLPCYLTNKNSWQIMPPWNPWVNDSGWYWELYNNSSTASGNLVGIFAGPTSRIIEPAMSGASIFTLPPTSRSAGKPVAGISSQSYRRSADAHIGKHSRFSWGLFVGDRDKDLTTRPSLPTINLRMNLFGSPVTLTKLAAMKMDYPDLPQGYGGLYMDKEALSNLISRVRQSKRDKNGDFAWLYNAEPSSRPLFDAWADETGAKMHAAAADIVKLAADLENELINGRGTHNHRFGYWHGGLDMMRRGLWIDQVLASGQLSAEENAGVKAAASLFAHVLWDNDFVPMDNSSGMNMGTANMPQQQQGYRYFYALFLATHPDFIERSKQVNQSVQLQVHQQINESGAHMGCPHYISASFAPTLNTLMQLSQLGEMSPLNSNPKLKKFGEFYLNLLTPPEVRFPGKPRSYIALGDSSTEASPLYGQLGTAFCKIDPVLSQRLMGAWHQGGKPHSGFFGTTVMSIDDRLPQQDPQLHSATFPGYYSVLRSGWGSTNESAAWIVNGDFYSDHRNDDRGNIVLYALGVPISVHWGSIYSPHAAGAFYHSSVLPEAAIGWPWDKSSPPTELTGDRAWMQSKQIGFSQTSKVDTASSQFVGKNLVWTRILELVHDNPATPIFVIRDNFDGSDRDAPKILSLNLMARGAVQTPVGEIIPEMRIHPYAAKAVSPTQLPSAGQPFDLQKGINRFSFKGQFDVDFDLFVIAKEKQQALLGNWAVSWTQQPIQKWLESQDILRIKGTNSFEIVLVPYRAGHRPSDLNLRQTSSGLRLTIDGITRPIAE